MTRPYLLLLSGPNLNMLGKREPSIYGTATLDDLVDLARTTSNAHGFDLEHRQSNAETDLIEALHEHRTTAAGVIINAGAFTHYGWGLADALAMVKVPIVELHISNPDAREAWRHTSVVTPQATATVAGFGGAGYRLAVEGLVGLL